MESYFNQHAYEIRCEWGLAGIELLSPISDAIIVIDVFSFTTAVDIVVGLGGRVYPYRWRDDGAQDLALQKGAILATGSRRDPQAFSLSPTSLKKLPHGASVVLPSPNGSTLSLATGTLPTFAGCLRNAGAVAMAAMQAGSRISVIPAGERWPDGTMRPALEDWLGAGAVISHLSGSLSPEAETAQAAFTHARVRLEEMLAACSSGREVTERGSYSDVQLSAQLNISERAPVLINGAYQAS